MGIGPSPDLAQGNAFTNNFSARFAVHSPHQADGKVVEVLTGSAGLNTEFDRVTGVMGGDEWNTSTLENLEIFQV